MKTEVWISFNGSDIPCEAVAMLAAVSCGPHVTTIGVYIEVLRTRDVAVRLRDGDERVERLVLQLERHGEPYLMSRHDRYTDEELGSARLLLMKPNFECDL